MGAASLDPPRALNSSALAWTPLIPLPPVIRTLPSLRFAAHAPFRATAQAGRDGRVGGRVLLRVGAGQEEHAE